MSRERDGRKNEWMGEWVALKTLDKWWGERLPWLILCEAGSSDNGDRGAGGLGAGRGTHHT